MDIGSAPLVRPEAGAAEDFVPFAHVEGDPAGGYLVICDHAENRLPDAYGALGLPAAEFARHIAYDPGAAAVSHALARHLGAPAVMSTFSRLLIDPNRGEDDPTLIMRISDGAIVPGNAGVDDAERARRVARYYAPYHRAIDAAIDEGIAAGTVPALISVHSYTPVWRGHPRPWHAGVLWDRDRRMAVPLIEALRDDRELIVGDNEPYTGALADDCMNRHGTQRGIAHALIEIRQDLIADDSGAEAWAERLADIFEDLRETPGLNEIRRPNGASGHRSDAA